VAPGTDVTPPDVVAGSAVLVLDVPPGCPLAEVAALGLGGRATLTFVVTKRLAEPPQVTARQGETSLAFAPMQEQETRYTYGLLVPDELVGGEYEITVHLTGEQGVPATVVLETPIPLRLDGEPPALPDASALAELAHHVSPRPAAEGGAVPTSYVLAEAGTLSPETWLVVAERPDLAESYRLGVEPVVADVDVRVTLSRTSDEPPWLTLLDGSCNVAAEAGGEEPAFVPLRRRVLHLTPATHPDLEVVYSPDTPLQGATARQAVGAADGARLAAADGDALQVPARPRWVRRALSSSPGVRACNDPSCPSLSFGATPPPADLPISFHQ